MLGIEKGQAAGKTLKYAVERWVMGMCDGDHDCLFLPSIPRPEKYRATRASPAMDPTTAFLQKANLREKLAC